MRRCKGEATLRKLVDRAEQCVLRWFGDIERIKEKWLVKRIVGFDMRG